MADQEVKVKITADASDAIAKIGITEESFKTLGIKSAGTFNSMRQEAQKAFEAIKNSSTNTANDIIRAEQAKNDTLRRINEQQYGHQTTILESLKKNWIAASVAIGAAMVAMNKAWNLAEKAAQFEEMEAGLQGLSSKYKMTADSAIAMAKEAVGGQLSMMEAGKLASRAFALGFNPNQVKEFLTVSERLTDVMGGEIPEAFNAMERAAATGRKGGLVAIGINVDLKKTLSDYAAAHGIAEKSISSHMAMQIRANAIMVEAKKITDRLGEGNESTADKMNRMKATLEDVQLILGQGIIRAASAALAGFQNLSAGVLGLTANIFNLTEGYARYRAWVYRVVGDKKQEAENTAFADKMLANGNAAWAARNGLLKDAARNWELATASRSALAMVMAKGGGEEPDTTKPEKNTELETAIKSIKEAIRKATYEVDSVGFSQYQKDIDRIKSDAEEYRKKGVDKVLVAQFVAAETELALRKSFVVQTEENKKMYEAMQKGAEDYRKMVSEEQSFSVSKHEQAMLKIIANENNKLLSAEKLMDEGKISWDQYQAYLVLVQQNTSLATADLKDKELKDTLATLEQAGSAYQSEYNRVYELTVRSEADILEVKMKALGIYFDKAKWINDQLTKHYTTEFQKNISSISGAFGELGSAFSQIAGTYEKGSKGAKEWEEAAKAMEIAQRSLAVVNAVVAVASASAAPWPAGFVTGAAMLSSMLALLASIGEGLSSSSIAETAPALPKSTVLGAADGTGSESISKSFELLEDIYSIEDIKLTKIYNELKDLNNNITGLVTSFLRSGGTGAVSFSVPGDTSTFYADIAGKFSEHITDGMMGNIGTIGSVLGGLPGMNFITGWATEFIGSAFAGAQSSQITEQGFAIGKNMVGNLLAGAKASVQNYAQILTTTEGGWFNGDDTSISYQYQALTNDQLQVQTLITKIFKGIGGSLVAVAESLGTDVAAAKAYIFEATKINLQGKTAEEITKSINEYFSNIADKAAAALFQKAIGEYQKVGEGLLETAVRLLADKEVIANYLKMTNQAFTGTIPQAIKFSETLITIAGSLDKLTDAMQTYYDAFFNDAEKQAKLKEQLTSTMAMYSFDLPGTRSGYRALVESLNLTTDAGQKAYVALMQMSKGADEYYKYLEQAKESIKPENYSTNLEYQRALAALPKYADGGIASGPMTGYTATLHGTELVISPRKSYPATVNGASYAELLSEVKALRREVTNSNFNLTTNTNKIANFTEYLEQWNSEGMPT